MLYIFSFHDLFDILEILEALWLFIGNIHRREFCSKNNFIGLKVVRIFIKK